MAVDTSDHRPIRDDDLPPEHIVSAAVALFSAIAHPVRLLVLLTLHRRGPTSAGDLQALAGVEQTAMSHQLRILREAHLVRTERHGRRVIYDLVDHHIAHIVGDGLAHATEARP